MFFTPDQYAAILKLLAKKLTESESNVPTANMAGIEKSCSSFLDTKWIIDTSANDHMVGHLELLHNFRSCVDATGSIQLSNGSSSKISSLGTIPINKSITLTNVVFVLDFRNNLLSISKFTKDHHCFVTFFPRFCVFQGLSNEKITRIDRERHELYYLDNSSLKPNDVQPSSTLCGGL